MSIPMQIFLYMLTLASIIFIPLIVLIILDNKKRKEIEEKGIITDAYISKVDTISDDDYGVSHVRYTCYVKFIGDDGKEHETTIGTSTNMSYGRKIKIKYVPGKYDYVLVESISNEFVQEKDSFYNEKTHTNNEIIKYHYLMDKKITTEEIICYIVSILLLIIGIFVNTKSTINTSETTYILFTSDWWHSMTGIILTIIFMMPIPVIYTAQRKNFKKWRTNLIKNDNKYEGKVTKIRKVYGNQYKIQVSYYSDLYQKERTFETPTIIFEDLDPLSNIKCDVYENKTINEEKNYASEVIKVSSEGNKMEMNINSNPLKITKVVVKNTVRKGYGNCIAENFKYKE